MRLGFVFLLFFIGAGADFSQAKIAQEPAAHESGESRKPSGWFNWWRKKPQEVRGNLHTWTFKTAVNRIAEISEYNPVTVYCPCTYKGKTADLKSCGFLAQHLTQRSVAIEWEHVAAAESFGQSFKMWRDGDSVKCKHKKKGLYQGRECAVKDPEFRRMLTDLYNLWPIIGELNALRSNMTMAEISGASDYNFGGCKVKIQDRKFEPMDEYKGMVARTHLYMEWAYPEHGIISNKNEKLFEAWDKMYPVSAWECQRAELIKQVQGNANPILEERCGKQNAKAAK